VKSYIKIYSNPTGIVTPIPFKEVLYPGEIEWLTEQKRRKEGILIEDKIIRSSYRDVFIVDPKVFQLLSYLFSTLKDDSSNVRYYLATRKF
jgi:hypothetical protein